MLPRAQKKKRINISNQCNNQPLRFINVKLTLGGLSLALVVLADWGVLVQPQTIKKLGLVGPHSFLGRDVTNHVKQ